MLYDTLETCYTFVAILLHCMGKLSSIVAKIFTKIPAGHGFFSGDYADGEADYLYISSGKEHIIDGNFQYHSKSETGDEKYADGLFSRGIKQGNWSFRSKDAKCRRQLNTYFLSGIISGDLDLTVKHADGRSEDLNLLIINGEVCGGMTGHFDKGYFKGSCDDNGYADGTWTLVIKEGRKTLLTKNEIWVHGQLKESYEQIPNKQRTPMEPCLRERINIILMNEVSQLLHIVPEGTKDDVLHIRRRL